MLTKPNIEPVKPTRLRDVLGNFLVHLQTIPRTFKCMSKKSWPFLYSTLLYKIGPSFLFDFLPFQSLCFFIFSLFPYFSLFSFLYREFWPCATVNFVLESKVFSFFRAPSQSMKTLWYHSFFRKKISNINIYSIPKTDSY